MKKHEQFDWNADSCSYREYDADADWEGINLKCFWKMHEKCKEIRVYHSSPVKEVTAVHQFRETPRTFIKVHWWDQVIFEISESHFIEVLQSSLKCSQVNIGKSQKTRLWIDEKLTEVFTGDVLDRGEEDQQSLTTSNDVDVHSEVFTGELWWISNN